LLAVRISRFMAICPLFMAGAPRAPVKVPSRGRDRQKWYLPGPFPDGPGIGAEAINLGPAGS
jgi:hypothetical protein